MCALVGNDRALFAEKQLLRAVSKCRNTFNSEIVFGGLILQQILLSFSDASQKSGFTGFIFISAHAQVDFIWVASVQKMPAIPKIGSAGAAVIF